MARIRSIHPAACTDEDVATMSLAARLVWAYLPCHADREGRLKDSLFTLKTAILPADDVDINEILEELAARRHIVRYQTDKGRFIQIRNFKRYQNPHKNELTSTIPEPVEKFPESLGKLLEHSSSAPEKDRTAPAVRSGPDPSPDPVQSGVLPSIPRNGLTGSEVIRYFGDRWRERYNGEWWKPTNRDVVIAREFVEDRIGDLDAADRARAEAEVKPAIDRYFAVPNEFYVKRAHGFDLFIRDFDALRVAAAPTTPSPPPPRDTSRLLSPFPAYDPDARKKARAATEALLAQSAAAKTATTGET